MELPREGDLVAGKYTIERTLGAGAMGVVVSAMHVQLGERVALKFLNPDMAKNQEVVARFLREAQSAARIKGEHVARVTDVGTLDSGIPYLVMEYLQGIDLGAWLEKKGTLGVELAVELVLQACEALAEAHAMGIVHRDLKPANLFVATRSDGSALVKVLDFGIAKLLKDGGRAQLTALGAVMGSPLYMSPELLSNAKGADARSDVWQMGLILYEALTGKPAFDGGSLNEVIIAIATKPAPRARDARADVPEAVDDVIQRCLEKDPDKRLPDVAAIAEALSPFATTRRGQVCVEHAVVLARGAEAALPPMRAPMRSSVSLVTGSSSASMLTATPADALAATMFESSSPGLAIATPPPPGASAPPGGAAASAPPSGTARASGAPSGAPRASGAPSGATRASGAPSGAARAAGAPATGAASRAAAAPRPATVVTSDPRLETTSVTARRSAEAARRRTLVAIAIAASIVVVGVVTLAVRASTGAASAQPPAPAAAPAR